MIYLLRLHKLMPPSLLLQPSTSLFFETNRSQKSISVLAALSITVIFYSLFKLNIEFKKSEVNPISRYTTLRWITTIPTVQERIPQTNLKSNQSKDVSQMREKVSVIDRQKIRSTPQKASEKNAITIVNAPEKMATEDVFSITTKKQSLEETIDASPNFKYDRESIRKAYQDSKTDIQKMAEASGKPLPKSDEVTEVDQFNQSVKRAAKKDCFSANSGGSLLSLIIIPIMAATDKCKM